MKKFELSQKTQNIFWGIMCAITALTFVWVVSFFN